MNFELWLLRGMLATCMLACVLTLGNMISLPHATATATALTTHPVQTAPNAVLAEASKVSKTCALPADGVLCLRPAS